MKFAVRSYLRKYYLYILLILPSLVIGTSCAPVSAPKNMTVSQNGDNKRFPSKRRASLHNNHYKSNKDVMKDKQRKHANFQGHDEAKQ